MTDQPKPEPGANDPADESATGEHKPRTWTEQIDLAGDQLVATVKRLVTEGKVRRIRITEPDGDLVLEIPLTVGAIAGGAVVLAAPLLAAIGAIAALVTRVRVEIVREGGGGSQV